MILRTQPTFTHVHGIGARKYSSGPGKALGQLVSACHESMPDHQGDVIWKLYDWSEKSDLPDGGFITDAWDMMRDVKRFATDPDFRAELREGFYEVVEPNDCVVAHSLGSCIAVDAWLHHVAKDLKTGNWSVPFASLVTVGSPLGLMWGDIQFRKYVDAFKALNLPDFVWDSLRRRWLDLWNKRDLVATGTFAGWPIAGHVQGLQSAGYPCRSLHVGSGRLAWIDAHTGYYKMPLLPGTILSMGGRPWPAYGRRG